MEESVPAKIGILIDSEEVCAWQVDLIRGLASLPGACVCALIVLTEESAGTRGTAFGWFRSLPVRLLSSIELRRLRLSPHLASQTLIQNIANATQCPFLFLTPHAAVLAREGHLFERDRTAVQSLNLDLIVDLSSSEIGGLIAETTRYGAIWLAFGADLAQLGEATGFSEVLNRQATTDFAVCHVSQGGGGRTVLTRGSTTTQTYFLRNQTHVIEVGAPRLVQAVERLLNNDCQPSRELEPQPCSPLPLRVSFESLARYLAMQGRRIVRRLGRRLWRRRGSWHVLVAREPWTEADLTLATELKAAPGTWIADPFLFLWNDRTYCLVEEYVTHLKRGRIALFDLTEGHGMRLGVVIEEEFHLSFPFVFKYEGTLFVCPESAEARQIRVYRCEGDHLKWSLSSILMEGVNAVDSILIPANGEWMLLTNIDESGSGDYATGLWAFRALNPLSDEWTPDPCNPVVTQSASIRNGGLVWDGEVTYRIGQVSNFDAYGSSIWIHRLAFSTEGKYVEQPHRLILPDFHADIEGTHHMSSVGATTVVDVYRE